MSVSARSVLVSTSRSATATCLVHSGWRASWAMPFTASTVVMTLPRRKWCLQHRVGLHRGEDGKRIGQARALDDQPAEARHLPTLALAMQVLDRRRQLAADGAAQAARLQQHHGVVDALQQMMIEPDLAELVDQHGGVGQRRIGQQALQKRGLARTQEARDQVDRDEDGLSHRSASSRMMRSGSSGSQGRPSSFSAVAHRWVRLSTISVLPVAVDRT